MLRIIQTANAAAAKKYYSTADYYSEGQEIVGNWGGRGAELLGLDGVVDREIFDRLCDNLKPYAKEPLTVRTRSERTVGYDFNWSVPKSVSVLYALSGDRDLLEAFRSSVHETMQDIEKEIKTRVRKDGKDEDKTTGNMVWAEFIHTTSRPVGGVPDPQLHAHCFTFNSTWDAEEKRWKAGQFRDLKRDAPYFQAVQRSRLADRLQGLGYEVSRKKDDFEIVGVPDAVLKKFSRRTAEIEKLAAERGIVDPKRKAELGAETRERKNEEHSWNQLRKIWDGKLTKGEHDAIAATHRREKRSGRPETGNKQAIDYAIGHVFAQKSVATDRELTTHALQRSLGSATVEKIQSELARRPLIRFEQSGRTLVTTDAVLAEEKQVVAFAKSGRGRFGRLGDETRELKRPWLNAGQKEAVRHVLSSRDRVTMIRGAAGTGKTKMMEEAIEGITEAGRHVVVLAPTVGASFDVLRKEGFADANTVAKFLVDPVMQKQAKGQVLWIDEANMMGMQDMAQLFEKAKEIDARVVLSGDRHQHRAVARGEPLKLLEEKAGLPVAQLTEIMRQEPKEYRQAVEFFSSGKIMEGFTSLDKLGAIREIGDEYRNTVLAQEYLAAIAERKKNGDAVTALVVSPTHAEAGKIAGLIRESLKAEKKITKERDLPMWSPKGLTDAQKTDKTNYEVGDMIQWHKNAPGHKSGSRTMITDPQAAPTEYAKRFEVFRPSTLSVGEGDRLRVTKGGKTKDGKHVLATNALLTVKGFTRQGDLVVDHDWVVSKDFGLINQGYVVTSHASEGKTVDRVLIGQSSESFPASNSRQIYVSTSRGRQQVVIFTDNREELLRAVKRADEPMSA